MSNQPRAASESSLRSRNRDTGLDMQWGEWYPRRLFDLPVCRRLQPTVFPDSVWTQIIDFSFWGYRGFRSSLARGRPLNTRLGCVRHDPAPRSAPAPAVDVSPSMICSMSRCRNRMSPPGRVMYGRSPRRANRVALPGEYRNSRSTSRLVRSSTFMRDRIGACPFVSSGVCRLRLPSVALRRLSPSFSACYARSICSRIFSGSPASSICQLLSPSL